MFSKEDVAGDIRSKLIAQRVKERDVKAFHSVDIDSDHSASQTMTHGSTIPDNFPHPYALAIDPTEPRVLPEGIDAFKQAFSFSGSVRTSH